MMVSEESTLHKMPPSCKDGRHKEWKYQLIKFTDMDDDDRTVDTYFAPVCRVCREIKH